MKKSHRSDSVSAILRSWRTSALALAAWFSLMDVQANWPSWRGPQFNGSAPESQPPIEWNAEQTLWKVVLPGKGASSPIVWEDRIVLTSPDEGQDAVLAFDPSGRLLWKTVLGAASAPKHRTLGSSCNASPVTDGRAVYVYFRSGTFAALELNGDTRWKVDLTERFGAEQLFWDQGSSPVITQDYVVLTRMHGGESWVAGFDRGTGEMRWQQPRNYPTPTENDNAYTTPLVYREGDKEALLVWGADHLTAHDAASGSLLWSCGGFNPAGTGFWPAIASPLILGEIAVVPVGRDDRARQSRVHGIRLGGRGDVTDSHRLWKREDLGVFVASPATYEGKVYLLRHRGGIVCLDPVTGRTIWADALPQHRSSYYASPLITKGILYAAREDGTVFAARVGDRFELLAENPMGERILASPVPLGNRLLIRTDAHLFCIGNN
jgi:outer membrane protein assembly factor BamB